MENSGKKKNKLIKVLLFLAASYIGLDYLAKKKEDSKDIDDNNQYLEEAKTKHKSSKFLISQDETLYVSVIKPLIGRFGALIALILLSPLFAAISFAIYIDDPGPIFFTQKRVGKNKHFFSLHKFRSMKMSTPHDVPTHQLSNPDQYITRVGAFLRKSSLDELPQLWDIWRGKIAFCGPRPALWNQDDLVAERDKYHANDILPGLSGLAQINGRDELEICEKARIDGIYAKALRKSSISGFIMDAKCFFGTFSSVLKSEGVVEGGTGEMEKNMGSMEYDSELKAYIDCKNGVRNRSIDGDNRVLFICNHVIGIYNFRLEIVERMLDEGYEVHICCPALEHIDEVIGLGCVFHPITIDRHGMNPFEDIKIYQHYKKLFKQIKPLVVFGLTIKPNIYGGVAAKRVGVPFVANVTGLGTSIEDGGLKAKIIVPLYKFGLKNVQKVFFQNEANLEFMRKNGIVGDNYELLPGSGVNLSKHTFEEYPEDTDKLLFTTIGRVMKDKGTDELLEAAKIVKKSYPDVRFRMIGFFDDDYEEKIDAAVNEGIIEYIPQQADIHPFMKETHAVIHPSYHEGMSNVCLEAAATGRVILASNIPGCRETFDEGITGYGFEAKSAESLAEAVIKFIETSYEKKVEMGKKARIKMEQNFNREICVEKYLHEIPGYFN